MAWKLLKPEYLKAIRAVMLMGGAIYLTAFGLAMAHGPIVWIPDFLGTHGEPYLVLAFAFWAAYEAIMLLRST